LSQVEVSRGVEVAGLPARRPSVVADRHSDRSYWLRRLLFAGDLVSLLLALLIALEAAGHHQDVLTELLWALPLLPVMAAVMRAYGLYDRRIRRISHSVLDDMPSLFNALVIAGIALWLYYRYLPAQQLVYAEVVIFGAASALLVISTRAAAFRLWARLVRPERAAFLGIDNANAAALLTKVRNHREYHLEPVGMIGTNGDGFRADSLPLLGHLEDSELGQQLERLRIDRLLVGQLQPADRMRAAHLMREGQRRGVEVSMMPELFDLVGPSAEFDEIEGLTVLTVHPPVLSRSSRILKRGLDLIVSSLALVLVAPLLAVIAVAVKLDSPGPALFRQTRIGKAGRRFTLLKFRTMSQDADSQTRLLMAASKDPDWLLLEEDPRITRIGRLLRRTSLDELPQLWNVLRGEMSLVGPRPLSEIDDRLVRGWARARLDLVPGLTGLWQVLGRTSIPFQEMVKLDTVYVTNWSLWGDIKLMLRTLPVLLRGKGVN
jgi:exopolysaccharide biosynthesis polyprenyl glycosylphosphotransferase